MLQTRFLITARNLAAVLLLSTQLVACLGSEETKSAEDITDNLALSGNVGDGPVVFASMRLYRNDGVELASFESDANANYLVNVSTTLQYFPLVVQSTGGTDIVTNLAPDFVLESAVYAPASRRVANVNPFSTYIVSLARRMPGGLTEANLQTAQTRVSSVLNAGLNGLGTQGPMVTHVDEGNITEMVMSSETLAETVRRTRDLLNAFGFNTTGDQVIRAIASDITDSVIDGRGGPNTDARTAAVMTLVIAQVYMESMANELFVNGVNATAAIDDAITQTSARTPTVSLEELAATREMIAATRTGLAAALALDGDTKISALHSSVSGLQHGMMPSLVRTFLPADYRTTLQNALNAVAGGNAAIIDMINDVARDGGDIGVDNRAPSIGGTAPTSIMVGSNYSFTPSVADPDGDVLTFSIANQPGWASFDTSTGRLSGTPADADAGSYANIGINVSDGEFTASLPAFTVNVNRTNSAPNISGTPSTSIIVGNNYAFTPSAVDPDGDNLTFAIANRPGWATFNTSTGRLSGTPGPMDVGSYNNISISVSDGIATDALSSFSITVQSANTAPSISGTPATSVSAGNAYSFTPTASDPQGDNLSFSVAGLPSWATFNTSNGRISGTPVAGDVGVYSNIRITVSDGLLSDVLGPFSITVNAVNSAPSISGTPTSSINTGTAYTFTPAASDADGDNLSFSVSGLPSWASFNSSNGRISGTPTAGDVGVYSNIRITVSDGSLSDVLGPFSITVNAMSNGSVTLNWTPPTENADGTTLVDLAGYNIYWGTSAGNYPNSVTINNASVSTYVVDNLAPGTYEFVATSFNAAGEESTYSNLATKVIP